MKLVWSFFLVFKSTGIGGEEILPLKFGLHLPWNLVSGTTKNFMDWISGSWVFQIGFYIKFIKVKITFKVFVSWAMWLLSRIPELFAIHFENSRLKTASFIPLFFFSCTNLCKYFFRWTNTYLTLRGELKCKIGAFPPNKGKTLKIILNHKYSLSVQPFPD